MKYRIPALFLGFCVIFSGSLAGQGRGRGFGSAPRAAASSQPFATRSSRGPEHRVTPGRSYGAWPRSQYRIPQPYGVNNYYPNYPTYSTFLPYIGAPTVYAAPAYVVPAPVQVEPYPVQRNAELAYEVERLAREVAQLRVEQAAAAARQPMMQSQPLPAAPERPAIPTTLVFRDGRRVSVQNYAIVGQTLWILDEQTSTRIALADLDVAATEAENRGRGVRFMVPAR